MKKINIIGIRSQKDELIRDLMRLGTVQIDVHTESKVSEAERKGLEDVLRMRSSHTNIENALKQLNNYAPAKKGLLTPKPEAAADEFFDESRLAACEDSSDTILSLDLKIKEAGLEDSRLRSRIETLTPWKNMDQDLSITETKTCGLMYGTVPAAFGIAAADALLKEHAACAKLISSDRQFEWIALVYRKEARDEVLESLRGCGFSPITLNYGKGTPSQHIVALSAELEQLRLRRQHDTDAIVSQSADREKIELSADILASKIARCEACAKSSDTASTFTITGWVPAADLSALEELLDGYDCAYESSDPDPENPDVVPVKLINNKITAPYNMITEMYSLPAYNGLDPNPFIMPFFALFFGIMFADMAYGLILLAAGIIFLKKAKPKGSSRRLAGLLVECGISTFILGFLTGGFFGDVITQIGSWFGQDWHLIPDFGAIHIGADTITLPLNLLEGNNPLYVLIAAIGLGAIHLFVGVAIGCYLKIRDGKWVDAIFNDMSWWIILIGLGLMALGNGNILLYIGLGMMALGAILTGKGFGRITGIVSAIYNGATGYLGDFLSYSRLMALMLAGSVIASVFNQLGSLGNAQGVTVGGTILFVIVFIIGHILNFGLNVIGCFVHTLRLQYLEFFGKWYRDGGKPFKPLKINSKYFDVSKEVK